MKRKAIVCDIDGVCLQTDFILDEIHELGLKGEEMWEYFYEHCNGDRVRVIPEMQKIITLLHNGIYLFISTARNEKCRKQTYKKLTDNFISPNAMLMRQANDYRSPHEVKREHLLRIMEEFDIVAFIDDDLQNCEMAKSLGILALRRV